MPLSDHNRRNGKGQFDSRNKKGNIISDTWKKTMNNYLFILFYLIRVFKLDPKDRLCEVIIMWPYIIDDAIRLNVLNRTI